jgi:hypothetical protein
MHGRLRVRMLLFPVSALPAACITLLLVAASAPAHSGANSHGRAHCTLPVHSRLVAGDAQARIIFVSASYTDASGNYVRGLYKSCLIRRGGWKEFAENYAGNGGLGDLVDIDPLKLAGVYFAYATSTVPDGGRYGAIPVTTLNVINTASGNIGVTPSETVGPGAGIVRGLVLTASGIAAWQSESSCEPEAGAPFACAWSVRAFDAKTGWSGTLDNTSTSQSTSVADPFDGPAIYTCAAGCRPRGATAIWWQRDGVWQSALAR